MPATPFAIITIAFHFWALPLGAALLGVASVAYTRTTPRVAGRLRYALASLRAVAFVLLVLILMDPRLARTGTRREKAKVVALVDHPASMSLPAGAWDGAALPSRFDQANELARELASEVGRHDADFELLYFSRGVISPSDTISANGQGTSVESAIGEIVRRNEGEHLGAIVLLSDGVDTDDALVRPSPPDVPVYAIGLGDTTSPDDVRIRDVDYSPVVHSPSRTNVHATVSYAGARSKRISIVLYEGDRAIFRRDTTVSPVHRDLELDIPILFPDPGRREFRLRIDVSGTDARPENNVRDVVIEAEKAKSRALIVDATPGWETYFLTEFLRRDQTFDFSLVSIAPGDAGARGKLKRASDIGTALADCDVVVLASVNEEMLPVETVEEIRRFVTERGGGLLVLPGPSSLFENAALWQRLGRLLPLAGTPPFRFNLQYTSVQPGAQAASNLITAQLVPVLSQADWQERSPLLGYYGAVSASPGSEVLLSVRGRSAPAFVYQTSGKGRVAVVSAGPLWRWKFLSDNSTLYNEIVSRLFDVLSRGEDTDRFVLSTQRNVFETGENPVVYAEIFNERMQPVTGIPVRVEVSALAGNGDERPLELVSMQREDVQSARFRAALPALPPGHYVVRGRAEAGDRTIASKPYEIRISDTSVEFRRTPQDRAALMALGRRSGGRYAHGSVAGMVDRMNLDARMVATVSESALRTNLLVFLVILSLLSAEWLLRKRAGMI